MIVDSIIILLILNFCYTKRANIDKLIDIKAIGRLKLNCVKLNYIDISIIGGKGVEIYLVNIQSLTLFNYGRGREGWREIDREGERDRERERERRF